MSDWQCMLDQKFDDLSEQLQDVKKQLKALPPLWEKRALKNRLQDVKQMRTKCYCIRRQHAKYLQDAGRMQSLVNDMEAEGLIGTTEFKFASIVRDEKMKALEVYEEKLWLKWAMTFCD